MDITLHWKYVLRSTQNEVKMNEKNGKNLCVAAPLVANIHTPYSFIQLYR